MLYAAVCIRLVPATAYAGCLNVVTNTHVGFEHQQQQSLRNWFCGLLTRLQVVPAQPSSMVYHTFDAFDADVLPCPVLSWCVMLCCAVCLHHRQRVPEARVRAAPDPSGPCWQQQQQQSVTCRRGSRGVHVLTCMHATIGVCCCSCLSMPASS